MTVLFVVQLSDLAHDSAQIFHDSSIAKDLALAGESFDPLRQVWVKMPAMDERQVYCLLATTGTAGGPFRDRSGDVRKYLEGMCFEAH